MPTSVSVKILVKCPSLQRQLAANSHRSQSFTTNLPLHRTGDEIGLHVSPDGPQAFGGIAMFEASTISRAHPPSDSEIEFMTTLRTMRYQRALESPEAREAVCNNQHKTKTA